MALYFVRVAILELHREQAGQWRVILHHRANQCHSLVACFQRIQRLADRADVAAGPAPGEQDAVDALFGQIIIEDISEQFDATPRRLGGLADQRPAA